MKIQQHKYAGIGDMPIFQNPNEGETPIGYLQQGTWLGLREVRNEWLHVISHRFVGWVKLEHAVDRPAFQLHALWKPGKVPQYLNLAG